jgi:lipopolysaccharide transport system ATP-binding protein
MDSGVTVLFVSHDTNAVKALCNRAVYLEHGKVVAVGSTDDVVDAYYGAGVKGAQSLHTPPVTKVTESAAGFSEGDLADQREFASRASFHRVQNGMAEWLNVQLLDSSGQKVEQVDFGQTIVLRMLFKGNVDVPTICMAYHIRDRNGFDVIYSDTGIEDCHITNLRADEVVVMDWEFTVHLREGEYTVTAMLSIPENLSIGKVEVCDFAPLAANFKVARGKVLPIYGAAYWPNKVSQQRFRA